jgi:hypothetical protein
VRFTVLPHDGRHRLAEERQVDRDLKVPKVF